MQDEEVDLGPYRVVVNHEEQYSIWPVSHEMPAGWRAAGHEGTKESCLGYIRETWTDMRPKSVRSGAPGG